MSIQETIKEAIKEIRQSRSRFQIEKFVLGQHDSPEMQYYQLCLEISTTVNAIKESELRIEKLEAEIEELLETGKKSNVVEAKIKRIHIEEIELDLLGAKKELNIFESIFEKFPKYTRQEIEDAQPEYWKQRLIRVGQLQHLGAASGVSWAQLEAIYQADLLPYAKVTLPQIEMLEEKPTQLLFTKSSVKQKVD